ncbi:hypothetical protein ACROYT_G015607 [Oculina patagonica]
MDLRDSRQPKKTLDRSGVEHERIIRLKCSRSSAKGVFTKRQNKLLKLMKDSNNVDQSSTASSARLKASVKKAALSVEAAALKKRQDMQMEELLLKQKKENLKIEVELAKAEAEELVYSRREERIPLTWPGQPPASTPPENDEKTVEDSESQKELCPSYTLFPQQDLSEGNNKFLSHQALH